MYLFRLHRRLLLVIDRVLEASVVTVLPSWWMFVPFPDSGTATTALGQDLGAERENDQREDKTQDTKASNDSPERFVLQQLAKRRNFVT